MFQNETPCEGQLFVNNELGNGETLLVWRFSNVIGLTAHLGGLLWRAVFSNLVFKMARGDFGTKPQLKDHDGPIAHLNWTAEKDPMTQFSTPSDPDFVVLKGIVTYIHTKLQKGLTKNESSSLKDSFFFIIGRCDLGFERT